jgi:hypothetical protein
VALALLAGCGEAPNASGALGLSPAVKTMRSAVHPDRGTSWLAPDAKDAKMLLYVGDEDNANDVFIYDYPSGKAVGKLTGFDGPSGLCVDAAGDVYVPNLMNGKTVEYARGGTKVLNTYDSGGFPIGCSVDSKGDLAVTNYEGAMTVYAHGKNNRGTTYTDSGCGSYWQPAGYDDNGNLYVEGANESNEMVICELPAGSANMRTVSSSGIGIGNAGAVTWDGKYLVLSGNPIRSGSRGSELLVRVTEESDGSLEAVSTTQLVDFCYDGYVDIPLPFILGKKNTPVNRVEGHVVLGPNTWCTNLGSAYSVVEYWKYPKGGAPFAQLSNPPAAPYGAVVSIAE